MLPVFVATTRTLDGFPCYYRAWHQEMDPPFRRSESAYVARLPFTRRALVVGRWHSRAEDVDGAIDALGFRPFVRSREESEIEDEVEAVEAAR